MTRDREAEPPTSDRTETVPPPPGGTGRRPRPGERELARAETVGRYAVLSHLGTGGMGSVYAAYDPDLDRKVALKLVRRDRASPAEQERLLREARALARLAHPNVVRVYDVGLHGESVFFAMEFVSGLALQRWLAAEQPGWRQVVELFQGVGRGLAAAHGRGLIHRDLKPQNILVGEDGTARIADFGLVRWLGEAGAGGRSPSPPVPRRDGGDGAMGTPAYMAPELAAGKAADELSDQYSFCVALHVALRGEYPPAAAGDGSESKRPRARGGRRDPSRSAVPAALWRVVRRGLEADPADRYPSMAALLHDLSRLAGRRRRRLIAAGALVLVAVALIPWLARGPEVAAALCDGGGERFAGVWDADRERALRQAFESSRSPFAADGVARVAAVLDRYRASWVAAHRDACLATVGRGEQSERLLDLRMLCLERRRQEAGALVDLLLAGGPELVPAAVKAAESLPRIDSCKADPELTLLSALPEDREARRDLERLEARLARQSVRRSVGQKADLEEIESIVEGSEALGYLPLLARARRELAMSLVVQEGDVDSGVETLELALADALGGGDRPLTAVLYGHLAEYTGYNQGNPERGRWWGRFAEATLAGLGPGHQEERFRVHSSLGLLAWTQGLEAEARQHWLEALRFGSEAFGAESPVLAQLLNNLALAAAEEAEAIDYLERALAIKERAYGSANPLLANTLVNLGGITAQLGRYREALPFPARAAEIIVGAHGPEHPSLAYPLILEGEILNVLDRPGEAVEKLELARSLAQGFGEVHPLAIQAEIDLADSRLRQLRAELAEEHLDRAAELTAGFPETSALRSAIPLLRGRLHLLRGEHRAARDALEEARSLAEQAEVAPPAHERILLHVALAESYLGLGQPALARPHLEDALELAADGDQLPTLTACARFLLARAVERESRERAVALAREAAGELPPGGSPARQRLGREIAEWLSRRERSGSA